MDLLQQLVFLRTYSQTKTDGYKETWEESVARVMGMHRRKFGSKLIDSLNIEQLYLDKKFLGSQRSLQFGGAAIERNNERIYNCSFLHIDSWHSFSEILYLLACGCGVGWSVQGRHVNKIISSYYPKREDETFYVEDSKEGWAESFQKLFQNLNTTFDYSRVRPVGATLSTGGTASGPEPLRIAHERVRSILTKRIGSKISSLAAHDIACCIADAIICGASRRSACISLFDADDEEMLTCKFGPFWETAPWRVRSNNSAIINRNCVDADVRIASVVRKCYKSNTGEPGIYLTNDYDLGTQPCVELSLKHQQFCNLTSVNGAACSTPEEFYEAVRAATIMGTLQACYDNFSPLLSAGWKKNAEEERLLGVSITGIADNWALFSNPNVLKDGAAIARVANLEISKKLGINPAARITCVKPEGTTSAFLGTSSGIHAAHGEHYVRRISVPKNSDIGEQLSSIFGTSGPVLEEYVWSSGNDWVVSIPMKSKEGSIIRSKESPIQLLERMKHVNQNWIRPSHRTGENFHNVSLTCSYKPEEEDEIIDWIVKNKQFFNGISLLPFDGSEYAQMPFTECTEEEYLKLKEMIDEKRVNLYVKADGQQQLQEFACAGGSCEIK